jgi:type II secretory ATPase GspE/PulE/Tfp pilus assembly ATPase PilB-like protein
MRKWTVNGAIRNVDLPGCYYVDPGMQGETQHCLDRVQKHQLVLLSGARASGKTTRLFSIKNQLEAKGYQVL